MDAAGLGAAEVLASNWVRDHTALAESSLLARGRRRIAVIGGALRGRQGTDRLRTDGHRVALTAAGVPFEADLVVPVNAFHWQDGADAATRLMQTATPPDALLCLNDNLALGALRALYETGVRVPGELDVVGFDDIEASRYSVPSLTSVAPDKREIARAAVSLLLERIDSPDPSAPCRDEVIGHRIMVRESSGG